MKIISHSSRPLSFNPPWKDQSPPLRNSIIPHNCLHAAIMPNGNTNFCLHSNRTMDYSPDFVPLFFFAFIFLCSFRFFILFHSFSFLLLQSLHLFIHSFILKTAHLYCKAAFISADRGRRYSTHGSLVVPQGNVSKCQTRPDRWSNGSL